MDKQIENNLVSNFETKLKLHDKNFTYQEFEISTKITKDFKIILPREIIQFLLKDKEFFSENEENSNFTAVEYFKLDEEKLESLSNQLKNNQVIDFSENNFIQDIFILKSLLAFFGSINKQNVASKFYHRYEDNPLNSLKESQYFENCSNYEN